MAKNDALKNLRILIHDLLKRKGRSLNEDGFSLLDLIVAIGVILVITSVSIGVYNGINSNAKHAAVERAANDVLKAAMLFESDGIDETKAIDDETGDSVAKQWMDSAGEKNQVNVTIEKDEDGEFVVNAGYGTDSSISISRSVNPNGSTCIDGILVGGKNTGDACATTGVKDPEIPGPAIGDTVSRLTYKCDANTTGYLAATDIVPGTKITMAGSDGSSKLIKYSNKSYKDLFYSTNYSGVTTDKVTMKKNVKYTIVINGQFDKLLTPIDIDEAGKDSIAQCLTHVNKLGADSEITVMSSFGGSKLISVPDSIPKKVTSLKTAFRGATSFNDPNVSKWDVSNVTTLNYTFGTARGFNQPLNNWNVSNVEDMYATFFSMSFDQPLDKWDTGKVKTLNQTFSGNKSFNQPLDNWDVSNVTNFLSTFYNTDSFNQPLSSWKTGKATSMKTMFSNNDAFDQDVSKWNVDKVSLPVDFNKDAKLRDSYVPEKLRGL